MVSNIASDQNLEVNDSVAIEYQICRLCHKEVPLSELTSTCLCPSAQSKVHLGCIENYIDTTGAKYCPICKFPYSIRYVRRYSIREGILIYNQHDLKMIWARITALLVVVFITVPIIAYSFSHLGHTISMQGRKGSRFTTTSMAFVYYALLVTSLYVVLCTSIIMFFDPIFSWFSWWSSVTKIKFGPTSRFNF